MASIEERMAALEARVDALTAAYRGIDDDVEEIKVRTRVTEELVQAVHRVQADHEGKLNGIASGVGDITRMLTTLIDRDSE